MSMIKNRIENIKIPYYILYQFCYFNLPKENQKSVQKILRYIKVYLLNHNKIHLIYNVEFLKEILNLAMFYSYFNTREFKREIIREIKELSEIYSSINNLIKNTYDNDDTDDRKDIFDSELMINNHQERYWKATTRKKTRIPIYQELKPIMIKIGRQDFVKALLNIYHLFNPNLSEIKVERMNKDTYETVSISLPDYFELLSIAKENNITLNKLLLKLQKFVLNLKKIKEV